MQLSIKQEQKTKVIPPKNAILCLNDFACLRKEYVYHRKEFMRPSEAKNRMHSAKDYGDFHGNKKK